MLFKDSALLDRIFRVFDADDDDQISFVEYLTCLSTISSKAPKDDKLKCLVFCGGHLVMFDMLFLVIFDACIFLCLRKCEKVLTIHAFTE